MIFWILFGLYFGVPIALNFINDPTPGIIFGSSEQMKNYTCRYVSEEEARSSAPEKFSESFGRGTAIDMDEMRCRAKVFASGERNPQTEAVLDSVSEFIPEIVRVAKQNGNTTVRWRVETFHPTPRIANAISTATKVALAEASERVLDAAPTLPAATLQTIQGKPPREALPMACKGFASGLEPDERLLTLFQMNPSESRFHAGICTARGGWQWLL
jgi:hypothetical protein